jgi:hypothetical protein
MRQTLTFLSTLLLLLLPAASPQAQEEGRLSREKWERLSKKLDYPTPAADEMEEIQTTDPRKERAWSAFFKVLAILGGIAIIAFILFQLLSGDSLFAPKNRKFDNSLSINLENIEANLPEADLPDFIRQALLAGDYRMAARLHYLRLIQLLSEREWIRWKKEKTNGDYLRELASRPFFDDFRQATDIFERIWYGDRRLNARSYGEVAAQFSALERNIANDHS